MEAPNAQVPSARSSSNEWEMQVQNRQKKKSDNATILFNSVTVEILTAVC